MNIKELQEKLFGMWQMFDAICREHHIVYYLDSGSAIGAVREHDFIPWDDDIDVAIIRADYERLKKILPCVLQPQYKFVEPKDFAPYFYDFVPRIIDTTVPLREETDEDRAYKNYQNRMSIDFIILDTVPDIKLLQAMIKFRSKMIYGLARSKRYNNEAEAMSVTERVVSGICLVLGKAFSLQKLLELYTKNTARYRNTDSHTFVRSNSILYFIGFYSKDLYSSTVLFPFHGAMAPLPSGYHEILTHLYGDYMTPRRDYKGLIQHAEIDSESRDGKHEY
jgi:lipopolysaccharide cholinephosphotransferase